MLENILLLTILFSPFIILILFIFCALKVSSMCSKIEELEELKSYFEGVDKDE